jgi:tetratricopeptide (TPR) repeat protein
VAEVLDASTAKLDGSLGKEPLVEASMLGVIASTNSSLGRYDQGFAASDRQLALLRASGGSRLELARALTVRGELYRAHGLYGQALAPLREALSLLNGLSGVDADRADALNNLGTSLANTHNEREAETLLRQSVQLRLGSGQARDAAAAVPMQNLAVLLANQGRYQEASQIVSRAVELQRQFSPDDPDILTTLGTFAAILGNLHQPAKAEPILRDIAERSARLRGPTHTDTFAVQVQLGEILTDLERYAEAETTLRTAAEGLERNEGPANRYTTGAWSAFTVAACEGDDANAGLEVARRIGEIRKQSLPAGDWHLSATDTDIGLCLVRLRRYAEADPLLLAARQRLEATRGPAFYLTQLNYRASQTLYAETGRADEAARMATKITH